MMAESLDHEQLHDYFCEVLGEELMDQMGRWLESYEGLYNGE